MEASWRVYEVADKPDRKYSPTKADLWDELCSTREELMGVLKEMNVIVSSNTKSQDKTIEMLGRMQVSIEKLNTRLEKEIGIPPKIFLLVVGVLLVIILSVAGLKFTELIPLLE